MFRHTVPCEKFIYRLCHLARDTRIAFRIRAIQINHLARVGFQIIKFVREGYALKRETQDQFIAAGAYHPGVSVFADHMAPPVGLTITPQV